VEEVEPSGLHGSRWR